MRLLTAFSVMLASEAAWAQAGEAASASGQPSLTVADIAANKATTALAKAEEATSEFDKIRTPDSPVFVLLGVSPTQIQRPTTPKELAVSLSSFVTSGGSLVIPDNLAIEVAPYWLWSRSRLSAKEYRKAGFSNIGRNLTVSLGTASTSLTSGTMTTTNTDLAAGLRLRIYDGKGRHTCIDEVKGLRQALIDFAAGTSLASAGPGVVDQVLDDLLLKDLAFVTAAGLTGSDKERSEQLAALRKSDPGRYGALRAPYIASRRQEVEDRLKEIKAARLEEAAVQLKSVDDLFSQCAKLESARVGLLIDAAGATAWTFTNSDAKQHQWSARSGWVTAAWESPVLNAVVLGRYIGRLVAPSKWDVALDLGARAIATNKHFAGSLEAIWRHRATNPAIANNAEDTYRLALAVDLEVSDGSWITVTFGRDFSQGGLAPLFALANLKWGFGEAKVMGK